MDVSTYILDLRNNVLDLRTKARKFRQRSEALRVLKIRRLKALAKNKKKVAKRK